MALDNFNRTDSLNAIVEAWTRFGSLPFITQKTIAAGTSETFEVSDLCRFVVLTFSWRTNLTSMQIGSYISGEWTFRDVLAGSLLSITRSGNRITYKNNDTSNHDVDVYIITFMGSAEEV